MESFKATQCQCIILYGNINNTLNQEIYISAVYRRIELVLYYRKHDIYTWSPHGLHQAVCSGEMTIIRANCLAWCTDCEMRHKSFLDHAYKQDYGMIVMFIFNN